MLVGPLGLPGSPWPSPSRPGWRPASCSSCCAARVPAGPRGGRSVAVRTLAGDACRAVAVGVVVHGSSETALVGEVGDRVAAHRAGRARRGRRRGRLRRVFVVGRARLADRPNCALSSGSWSTRSPPAPDVTGGPTAAWDAVVEASDPGLVPPAHGMGRVKAVNGWSAHRLGTTDRRRPGRRQVLVRRPRPLPWGFAYAPRGPVADDLVDAGRPRAFTGARAVGPARGRARLAPAHRPRDRARVGRDDAAPTAPCAPPAGARRRPSSRRRPGSSTSPGRGRAVGRPAQEVAPVRQQGALRRDRRRRRRGDRLGEFYRIYRETADRAGFLIRTEAAYRDVWEAYRPGGSRPPAVRPDRRRRAPGDALPRPLRDARRRAVRRHDRGRRRQSGQLPAQVGGHPLVPRAGRRATTCGAWRPAASPTSRPASAAARSATSAPGTSRSTRSGRAVYERARRADVVGAPAPRPPRAGRRASAYQGAD